MKGKIIPLNFLHTQDSETGHQVIRMTPPHVICHRNYFYQKCFTRDGSKLIFGGAFEGHWNYYLLDIAGQQATQLTDGPGDNTFGGFLSADDRSLWYVKKLIQSQYAIYALARVSSGAVHAQGQPIESPARTALAMLYTVPIQSDSSPDGKTTDLKLPVKSAVFAPQ